MFHVWQKDVAMFQVRFNRIHCPHVCNDHFHMLENVTMMVMMTMMTKNMMTTMIMNRMMKLMMMMMMTTTDASPGQANWRCFWQTHAMQKGRHAHDFVTVVRTSQKNGGDGKHDPTASQVGPCKQTGKASLLLRTHLRDE